MNSKRIIIIGLILILSLLIFAPNTYAAAASYSLKASNENPTVGKDSVTVTATVVAGGFNLTLSGNGETKSIVGQTDTTDNVKKTATITFTPSEAKEYTFTLNGDYTDYSNDNTVDVNKTIKVIAKAPEQPKEEENKQEENKQEEQKQEENKQEENKQEEQKQEENKQEENKPEEKQEEQPKEEPNFTDADQTMYVDTDVLTLRTDWAVKSGSQVSKGTELKVIATSDNKVNGYKWYKVDYKGSKYFVASEYLTSEKPEEKEEEKSNNANLKSLSLDGVSIKPDFKADVTSYTTEVGSDVGEITVNARVEDTKSTVDVKGNTGLKEGENVITVSVSAEDGTNKIYEIKVTKKNIVKLGLKSLDIKNTDMSKEFKTDKYNYTVSVSDVNKLDIKAVATIDTAKVEILGNEDLKDGENTVTIMVKSEDESETVTYQIKVNKNAVAAEDTAVTTTTNDSNKLDNRVYLYGGICGLAFILLLVLIVVLIRNKIKNRDDDENDFGEGNLFNYDKDEARNEYLNNYNNDETKVMETVNEENTETVEEPEETEEKPKKGLFGRLLDSDDEEDEEVEEKPKRSLFSKKLEEDKEDTEEEKEEEKPRRSLFNRKIEDIEDNNDDDDTPRRGRGKHF